MKSISIIVLTLSVLSLLQLVHSAKDPLKRKLLLASKLKAEAALNNLNKNNDTKLETESVLGASDKKINVTTPILASTKNGDNETGTTFSITVSDDLLDEELSEKEDTAVSGDSTSLTPQPRPGITYLGTPLLFNSKHLYLSQGAKKNRIFLI